jgi:transposase-like protein
MLLDKQREQIHQSIQGKRNEFMQGQEKSLNELRTKAMEVVAKTIPGWSEKVKADIATHAKQDGYTEQELGNIFDPRHARTLWKAMQYDKLSEKARAVVKASPVAKTVPSNTMTPQTKATLNFRKAVTTHKPNSPEFKQALQDRIAAKFGG